MNSNQRRKERRKYPVTVAAGRQHQTHTGICDIIEWLDQYIGKDKWKPAEAGRYWDTKYSFTNQEDATLFLLKWR